MKNLKIGEWDVKIAPEPFGINNRIYLFQRTPYGVSAITHDGKMVEIKPNEGTSTEEHYFAALDDEQLQALADGLANRGIKSSDIHRAEATLSAQSAHLEDMRKLVFEPSVIKVVNKSDIKEVK